MRITLAAVALLLAVNVTAGTIETMQPAYFTAFSGEAFVTVYGSGLGEVQAGPTDGSRVDA